MSSLLCECLIVNGHFHGVLSDEMGRSCNFGRAGGYLCKLALGDQGIFGTNLIEIIYVRLEIRMRILDAENIPYYLWPHTY